MKGGSTPAIRAALRGYDPSDEQWDAIAHPPEPLAIVAAAGSGKTAIMAARIVWMIQEGLVRPSQVLGLTFTNKAAGELEERIAAAFAEMASRPPDEPLIATYNSFADRIVREHGVRIGIDPEVGLLSEAQRWQLLLGEFDSLPPFDAVESRSPSSIVRSALSLADQCADHVLTPEKVAEADERVLRDDLKFPPEFVAASRKRMELTRVVRAYLDAKQRRNRIDFGDQVSKAIQVLRAFPEVATEITERYTTILLDEYQDTNVAQRILMQILAPTGHSVTAVGDARQNIFQWRGSTLFNLIDFPTKHFKREGETTHDYLSLSTNYRSGSRILAVANRIIAPVPEERRPGKPLVVHEPNGEGYVAVKLLADQYAEAGFIAEEIARLHGVPAAPSRDPTEWRDFAILVRRKSHIPRIYEALLSASIPVEVVGLGGLLQVPEVMDAVAWMRVVADPGPPANRWLARILLGPRYRIHYRDLAMLARWAARHTLELAEAKKAAVAGHQTERFADEAEFEPENVAYSLAESLDHLEEIEQLSGEARRRLEGIRREIAALRAKAGAPLLDLVQEVFAVTGIGEALDVSGPDSSTARVNLTNFLGVVAEFAPVSGEPSLAAFLEYLSAAEEVDETLDLATPAKTDSVKLMTVHQAKGLEFEVVFVPGVAARDNGKGELVDSIFPDERTSNPMRSFDQLPYSVREDAEHLPSPWGADGLPKKKKEFEDELKARAVEDERRLFYVALTRAKQRLYVTAAWWYERQAKPRGPSLFFNEVAAAPETERLVYDDQPEDSPLMARLAERAVWPPGEPRRIRPDDLFTDGYPLVVEELIAGIETESALLGRLNPEETKRAAALLEEHRASIQALSAAEAADPAIASLPSSISATSAVDLVAGNISSYDLMRPMPDRPSGARRIGTEIHRWIEEKARGLTGLADEEALDLPSAPFEESRVSVLKDQFRRSRYSDRELARFESGEPMAEMPFVLKVDGRLVRGRIDAVYPREEGGLEIVDFKTGAEAAVPEIDQLLLYAAALIELGVAVTGAITLTYLYLATGKASSRTVSPGEARRALEALSAQLAAAR